MEKVTLYSWPQSQKCMECVHGAFVMSDELTNSDYICYGACEENDGVDCPAFEAKEDGEVDKGD